MRCLLVKIVSNPLHFGASIKKKKSTKKTKTAAVSVQKIAPCLWFDNSIEEAVNFYVSVFKRSKVKKISRYGEAGPLPAGTVLTMDFQLEGQDFLALNGGPYFKFTEAISFVVRCTTQKEVDHYWNALSKGGDEKSQQCGWLKDRFGLSWQIVPDLLPKLLTDKNTTKANNVMQVMLKMKKIDIAELKKAYKQ